MSPTALILLFLIIANLPWLTERVFLVFPISSIKSVFVRLIELVVFYFASLLIAIGVEIQFSGEIYPQSWEFFVTTFCLFLVLAIPGVIYRYQWLPMTAKLK
ncbi:MAG: DUF2818 domain-containing protein [Gammaproteobacteria bacterium]|nr:MAG: DUF2818 domain-containing protein [Gammaproteobacteria bacterium]RKZ92563.1 MAG: DUF2818 domain-containing protein [Gammaproteobacteria bacterium]RKZ98603.1 MAG: DUF2818 domain-containing protein [Gammaproteobacteria bacterium]RKZ98857.1 MAG: DUF2818 domain-containing protein [Gammaproteobacteria bacterium]